LAAGINGPRVFFAAIAITELCWERKLATGKYLQDRARDAPNRILKNAADEPSAAITVLQTP